KNDPSGGGTGAAGRLHQPRRRTQAVLQVALRVIRADLPDLWPTPPGHSASGRYLVFIIPIMPPSISRIPRQGSLYLMGSCSEEPSSSASPWEWRGCGLGG